MAIRDAIVAACRDLDRRGINQGMAGNISVRDGDGMLITPSATPYDAMNPGDLAWVALDAAVTITVTGTDAAAWTGPLRPSSEWRFHRDILAARPDIGAVIHTHAPHCTALAMTRRGIPPCHYMVATFGGDDVRCCAYATFGTQALSDLVVEALQGRTACLMANHGMIACGKDLDQALWRAVELEALARHYLLALSAGGPVLLNAQDMRDAVARFGDYRSGSMDEKK